MTKVKTYLALICCFSVLLAGCGSGTKKVADLKDTNIKKVHAIYSFYMSNKGFKGPESEEALKAYLDSPDGQFAIKRMEMDPDKLDDYFVSERDGEPFVIRYGLKGLGDHAIVFEATGVEGKRMVALSDPIECEDDEYEDYLSGKLEGVKPDDAEMNKDGPT